MGNFFFGGGGLNNFFFRGRNSHQVSHMNLDIE